MLNEPIFTQLDTNYINNAQHFNSRRRMSAAIRRSHPTMMSSCRRRRRGFRESHFAVYNVLGCRHLYLHTFTHLMARGNGEGGHNGRWVRLFDFGLASNVETKCIQISATSFEQLS